MPNFDELEKENKELYLQLDKLNYKYDKINNGIHEIVDTICKECKHKTSCKKPNCHIYNIEQLLLK